VFDDIRVNMRLFFRCRADQVRFCGGVEPGHMRVQDCLEDHADEEGFGAACREELAAITALRVADFR
jgi:Golgi apparatus protein 1